MAQIDIAIAFVLGAVVGAVLIVLSGILDNIDEPRDW